MRILDTPLETKKLTFKNRLSYPPLFTGKGMLDGRVSRESLAYYDEKMKGGYFGLAFVEHCYIMQQGKASEGQVSVDNDMMIDGLAALARTIKQEGTKAVLQMNHAGSCTEYRVTGMALVGPSAIQNPRKGGVPKEMSQAEIDAVVQAFAAAALRAKKAGFDAVEIHSAHSYLLNQFYSPLTNHRTDEYGGTLENRIRIHLETIETVRRVVGVEYPVFLRLGACDYMPGGNGIEDGVAAAKLFEQAGIDLLDISGGMCGYNNPQNSAPGYFAEESKAIRNAVQIPVLCTGGIKTGEDAEALLASGAADLAGVGRAAMADSQWAENVMRK